MDIYERDNLELVVLCNALADDTITSAQLSRLLQYLAESAEARRFYICFMAQEASLCGYGAEMQTDAAEQSITTKCADLRPLLVLIAIAVVSLPLFFFARTLYKSTQPAAPKDLAGQPFAEPTDDGVAVLTQAVDVEWDQKSEPKMGGTIPPGVLRLKSGLAQIEFYSGASVLLEGHAELELISEDRCLCRNGKMRVVVPRAAQGFTVLSPEIKVVDRGTEFAVEVIPLLQTQVHVFDGKVELYPRDSKRESEDCIELLAGSGQEIKSLSGESFDIAADENTFVSVEELKRRVDARTAQRANLWKQHKRDMNQDPRLVAFYAFEHDEEDERTLGSHRKPDQLLDGAIVGCEWSEGRWPGKDALEFKRPGDRVRIHIPGEYDSLTLAAWVRVDGLDRNYNSILMPDDFDLGEIHWQILRSGQLRFSFCYSLEPEDRVGDHDNYDSSVVWDLSQIGQWIHVAVVVDNQSGFVAHFANGRELSREPLANTITLRIGDAQIGNWEGLNLGQTSVRSFNGRIDELIIMGQALDYVEIFELYEEGKH